MPGISATATAMEYAMRFESPMTKFSNVSVDAGLSGPSSAISRFAPTPATSSPTAPLCASGRPASICGELAAFAAGAGAGCGELTGAGVSAAVAMVAAGAACAAGGAGAGAGGSAAVMSTSMITVNGMWYRSFSARLMNST